MKRNKFDKKKEKNLWDAYLENRTCENRNKLITFYSLFIESISNKVYYKLRGHVSLDDIKSYAIDGIIYAIEKFDKSKKVQFRSYAYRRVEGSIYDNLRRIDWMPKGKRILMKKISSIIEQYKQDQGYNCSDEEAINNAISDGAIEEKEANKVKNVFHLFNYGDMKPLDADYSNAQDEDIAFSTEEDYGYKKVVSDDFFDGYIKNMCSDLQYMIVRMSFMDGLTNQEISEKVSMSPSRICQIKKEAISAIRENMEENNKQKEVFF